MTNYSIYTQPVGKHLALMNGENDSTRLYGKFRGKTGQISEKSIYRPATQWTSCWYSSQSTMFPSNAACRRKHNTIQYELWFHENACLDDSDATWYKLQILIWTTQSNKLFYSVPKSWPESWPT